MLERFGSPISLIGRISLIFLQKTGFARLKDFPFLRLNRHPYISDLQLFIES